MPQALGLCVVCFVGLPSLGSPCDLASFVFFARPLAAPWWLLPPPPLCFAVFVAAAWCSVFFFLSRCAPPLSPAFSGFRPRVPWALALCLVCVVGLPLLRSTCALASFVFFAWRLAVPWWLLPPPPLSCLAVFVAAARCCVPCAVLCYVSLGAVLHRAAARCAVRCCAVVCCVVLLRSLWCRCLLCRALWCCLSSRGPVLCGAVFCGVPPRCVLCAVCVLSWRVGARCCSPLCVVLCVSWGVVLCVRCPPRSVRCCASLCCCPGVVLFVWCVLLLALGAVVRCCVLRCFLWCSVVRCWVWWPVVVCWWCVSVSVSLSGCVVCFPAVGVLWCCAVAWCCAAVLCCLFAVLLVLALPSCGLSCCAVLRCWLSVLFFARWRCLCAVVPFPSLPARTKNTVYYPVLPRARL